MERNQENSQKTMKNGNNGIINISADIN